MDVLKINDDDDDDVYCVLLVLPHGEINYVKLLSFIVYPVIHELIFCKYAMVVIMIIVVVCLLYDMHAIADTKYY